MGSLSEAFTAAKQKRVRKIAKILSGSFEKGDRVKVVRMPPILDFGFTVYWLHEWVNLEGIYIGPSISKGVSRVFFETKDYSSTNGWLVDDTQLEHL